MKNRLLILSICLLANIPGFSQQDVLFTNYMFNTLTVNSGYAGTRDAISAIGIHRSQWVGFEGAPRTNSLAIHAPINLLNLGVGLSFVQENIGPTKRTSLNSDIAYRFKTGENTKLSFGLKAGLNTYSANLAGLRTTDQGDQSFANDISTAAKPNFGFGAYYYNPEKYYVGFSIPRFFKNEFSNNSGLNVEEIRHYFMMAGYVFKVSENVKFKPSVLAKATIGAPLSMDLNANFLFYEKLWIGAFWRRNDAVGILSQYWFNNQFRIGYAYGYTTSKLSTVSSGSHEVLVGYDFMHKKGKIKSPRYF